MRRGSPSRGCRRSGSSVMFNPSPTTTIAIPFIPGSEAALGPVVNDAYFGKVPGDRLVVRDAVLFFRADGQYRSKIGIPPARALPLAGSYDSAAHVLTLVQYTRPADASRYVNSMWEYSEGAFQRRRGQQLQRRTACSGKAAARTLLRARDLVARSRPGSGSELYTRSSHVSFRRPGGRARSHRACDAQGRTVRDDRRVSALDAGIHLGRV